MNIYQKNLPHNQITANSTLIEVSSFQAQEASIDFGKLFQQYNNPQGWMMVGGMLFVLLLLQISGTAKGKITTGKVSGISEKLVQQGKSKKAKVKRKNADFVGCLAILNGWLISAVTY
jgi:hypothetical protein